MTEKILKNAGFRRLLSPHARFLWLIIHISVTYLMSLMSQYWQITINWNSLFGFTLHFAFHRIRQLNSNISIVIILCGIISLSSKSPVPQQFIPPLSFYYFHIVRLTQYVFFVSDWWLLICTIHDTAPYFARDYVFLLLKNISLYTYTPQFAYPSSSGMVSRSLQNVCSSE